MIYQTQVEGPMFDEKSEKLNPDMGDALEFIRDGVGLFHIARSLANGGTLQIAPDPYFYDEKRDVWINQVTGRESPFPPNHHTDSKIRES